MSLKLTDERPLRRTINLEQAILEFGAARRTVYLWIKQGRADVTRDANGRLRIYADSLPAKLLRGRGART